MEEEKQREFQKAIEGIPWHSKSEDEVLRSFRTSKSGLPRGEILKRRELYGLNKLPRKEKFSLFKIILRQLKSPLVLILIIAGVITLFLRDFVDTTIIWVVVFVNTIFGFFQEKKASQALSKLQSYVKEKALVIRSGNFKQILAKNVVPGDILVLRSGQKIPADARIMESSGLRINEAALTGEWLTQNKKAGIIDKDTPLGDRTNMVFMGTNIEEGEGKAIVVATGRDSELGRIARLVSEVEARATPLQGKLKRLSKIIGIATAAAAVFVFVGGLFFQRSVMEMFITSVAVAVAAVPEGLPVAITVTLAIGMQRILKKKGLVRKLISAETLGAVSVIATDKTGTLTKAKMEVATILAGQGELYNPQKPLNLNSGDEVVGESISGSAGNFKEVRAYEDHIRVLEAAAYCTEAIIENPESSFDDWVLRGRPTEKALLLGSIQAGLNKIKMIKENPNLDRVLFNSDRKFSASLNQFRDTNRAFICGAPEKVLSASTYFWHRGEKIAVGSKEGESIRGHFEELMAKGLRVIAFASKEVAWNEFPQNFHESDEPEDFKDFTFLGFVGLKDPLRKGARESLDTVRAAGVRPLLVTGDHKITAKAIAEEVGIKVMDKNIMEGEEVDRISDKELRNRIEEIDIFARVAPHHKLKIIDAWQARNKSIAMTGDGVNDAPALKRSDIGIALGSGTDVAKEVADVVLLNDDFGIIVSAIEEGRTIFDNIRKIITFVLSDSFTEITLIAGSIFLGMPLPVTAAQILWSNFVEDSAPVMSLAFEPPEKDIMKISPRKPKESVLTREMKFIIFVIGIVTDLVLFGLFFYYVKSGYDIVYARTIIFSALGTNSLMYVFSIRSLRRPIWKTNFFSNKFLLGATSLGMVFVIIAVYVPFLQKFLGTTYIGISEWGIIIGMGMLNIVGIETAKWVFRKKKISTANF